MVCSPVGMCSNLLSIEKHHNQKQFGEERVCLAYKLRPQSVIEGSQRGTGRLSPSTSTTDQENATQTYLQASLMEIVSAEVSSSQMTSLCQVNKRKTNSECMCPLACKFVSPFILFLFIDHSRRAVFT